MCINGAKISNDNEMLLTVRVLSVDKRSELQESEAQGNIAGELDSQSVTHEVRRDARS